MLKIVLLTLLFALLAVESHAQLDANIGQRLDVRVARFVWLVTGDTPVKAWQVECGPVSGSYPDFEVVNDASRSLPAYNLVQRNGLYFCVVTALDDQFAVVKQSNEIVLELRGRWLVRIR